MEEAKNQINDLEHKEAKTTNQNKKTKQESKKMRIVKQPLGQLQAFPYSHHRGARRRKEQEIGNLFEEIMIENFPNLVKEIDMQFQEAQRVPNKMDSKKPTPRHSIIKMRKGKDKEKILKTAREKQVVTYRGIAIRLSANFSEGTLQAKRDWQEIFKVVKCRDLQPRLLYPAKISFRIEGLILKKKKM